MRRLVIVTARDRVPALRGAGWVREHEATVVEGGARRQDSVLAGVRASGAPVVLVHDGARPFPSPALIDRVAAAAADHGAAVPVVAVADSLKRVDDERITGSVERAGLYRAQTPQAARTELLLGAYEALGGETARDFSDEAGLLAADGVTVATVPGEVTNVKVTVRADLELAEAIAAARSGPQVPRVATAADSHPFGPGDGLRLGGIVMEEAPRLFGHSDGDVALHAVAGAILGACGLGDLGTIFPAGRPATRGIGSDRLLREVSAQAGRAGWRVAGLDLSIVGARPRLGADRLERMRRTIAELLGVAPGDVGVKASTGNLSGPEGAGRVISASALATVVRSTR